MKVGDRIGDRFTLEREIGMGGMSTVYLGRDEVLDRKVAVKILRSSLDGSDDHGVSERFEREGRTAARLSHANVVQVYDAGKDSDEDVSYIVMEYVSGGDLKDLIDREGSLPERKLTRLGADIAAGLEHAHERGIVHRDIKPQNIMLDEYGKPKLTDFGIARALDGTTNVTKTGSYLGTALYSAPEQLRGEAVTPRSDVYSLGMTLYHAATGEPPFTGSPIEVATQQMTREPPPPRSIGARITPDTEKLIVSCLAKEPEDRPSSTDLREGLTRAGYSGAAVADGETREVRRISGRPDQTVSLPTRTFQSGSFGRDRGPLIVGAVAVIFVLAALLGAWSLLGGSGGETPNGSGGNGEQNGGNNSGNNGSGNGGSGEQGSAGGATTPEETTGAPEETTSEPEETQPENTAQESDSGPLPPTQGAADAVYGMYLAMPYGSFDESWSFLSDRYQDEVGSVGEWEQRYESVSYVTETSSPQATLDGREARVEFGFDLTRPDGDQSVSGTWICVNQDGEWKLDRLIEN